MEQGIERDSDIDIERHVEARMSFTSLLLQQSDYFDKVFKVNGNSSFEQLTCVGLEPEQHALYATIAIKQANGYGGDLCDGPGGREYVRFFADFNGDGDFADGGEDLGVASVAVYDIPGPKPLSYAVTVPLTREQRFCFLAKTVKVRAVLMYNAIPPAGNPNPPIVWGGILDANVQPKSGHLILGHLLTEAKVKLSPALADLVDASAVVAKPKTLTAAALVTHYAKAKADVPLHRSLAPELAGLAKNLSSDASQASPTVLASKFEAMVGPKLVEKIDIASIIGKYLDQDGDTSFEELHCVGLHPDLSAVVAVLDVKKASGYSGGLCTTGSVEFVSFWADWDNNGTYDEYLGTSQVRVHDEPIPAGGIQYSVFLPVNLAPRRRPCGEPHTARIRAVLSWNTPPSSTNPYVAPTWGNHVEALVQLPVGDPIVGQVPFISVVGGMDVDRIAPSGFATGIASALGFEASDSPFAGLVVIGGHIFNPPDLSAGQPAVTYGLKFRRYGDLVPQVIANSFPITLTTYSGFSVTTSHPTQSVDAGQRYTYREDLTNNGPGGDVTHVEGYVLGRWQTLGLPDGRYELWMEADIAGSPVESNHVWVYLDNTPPVAELALSSDPFTPQGTPVTGTFRATDDHLHSWGMGVLPAGYPNAPAPASGTFPVAPGTPFSLSTTAVTPGGYVLQLSVLDRSILNSAGLGQWATTSVGFCVEQP